ncbi:MAG: hypothetical protein INR69_08180 [Mucilaginibacter polytrichastri]|nr:hypothetical protein [Mucilaginibacter polytrichastri]
MENLEAYYQLKGLKKQAEKKDWIYRACFNVATALVIAAVFYFCSRF